jgi:F-type H+-transporting ATPase subunit c
MIKSVDANSLNSNERMVTMAKYVKYFTASLFSMFIVTAFAPFAMAAQAAAPAGGVDYTKAIVVGCALLAAGIAMGLGTIGTGLGMGQATSGGSNAVGRNPEAQGKILLTMMVGLAMTESVAIYALVVSLIILYANPLLKVIAG